MHHPQVNLALDSISPEGHRLRTFQMRYWRPIHSELMTHRVFSRSAGSSRARPSKTIIEQVRTDPWGPLYWGKNQSGMQALEELTGAALQDAQQTWRDAAVDAADQAEELARLGTHKQIVNRILEPYTFIDVVVTATDFANWYRLRNHPDAQPEIQILAQAMLEAEQASTPRLLRPGEWHLPFIVEEDYEHARRYLKENRFSRMAIPSGEVLEVVKRVSTARCARTSYRAFDGNIACIREDYDLFERLIVAQPMHASPAEHQATPDTIDQSVVRVISKKTGLLQFVETDNLPEPALLDDCRIEPVWLHEPLHGNFTGWNQYRKMLPNEFVPG